MESGDKRSSTTAGLIMNDNSALCIFHVGAMNRNIAKGRRSSGLHLNCGQEWTDATPGLLSTVGLSGGSSFLWEKGQAGAN